MPTLALDLGMTTGWALRVGDTTTSGVWNLKGTKKHPRTYGEALLEFGELMEKTVICYPTWTIVYEDVRRHMGTRAAHVYGALEGMLHVVATVPSVTIKTFSVQQIKQHATGRCVAGKDEMLAAAQMRWPWCKTHDEADALWLLGLELMKS